MIKMIVCDMDGTLLNKDHTISKENLDAIKQIRQKGIRFCIATGRPEQLLKEYIKPLNMEDDMIMYNGSVIGHPFKDDRTYELRLSSKDVEEVINYCEDEDIIYMVYTKDKIISKPNYRVDYFEERNKNLKEENKCIFEDIRDIDVILENSINKVLLIENDENKSKELLNFLSTKDDFEVVASQKGFIDVNPKGATKGKALEVLAKKYNYSLEDIVVFGDQDNDVSMMKVAGKSVVMANGSKKAIEAADEMTVSNNESGVAKWINENLL